MSSTALGDHRFDGELDEVTAESRERQARFFERYLQDLGGIERGELSRAHQVDAALLDHDLRASIWRRRRLWDWTWNPLVYTVLAGDSIYNLMARELAPLEARLVSAASRLEKLPRLWRDVRSVLVAARVPRVHAETADRPRSSTCGR